MKNIIILIALISSMNVFAGSLISMTTGNAWPTPFARTISVDQEGLVTLTEQTGFSRSLRIKELATLSDEVLESLKAKVSELTPEKLFDPAPNTPECYDAPTTTVFATLSDGEEMKVFQKRACKSYILQSWVNGPIADSIVNILNGFSALDIK